MQKKDNTKTNKFTMPRIAIKSGFLAVLLAVLAGQVYAQNIVKAPDLMVLPQVDGPQMIPYLAAETNQAWILDHQRMRQWDAIRNEVDLLGIQRHLRRHLLASIGGLPEKRSDLRARSLERLQLTGFRIEKVIYESLPHVYVTALVYVPEDGHPKHPAVLVPAGHAANGKIHYQELAQRLVRSGYIVLSWDPIGQGERSQFWDPVRKSSPYNLITNEHAILGRMALLRGQNLARYEIWDGMRAVDYLLSRRDVDSTHLAITGTSGGGFQAAMLGALDPRIGVIIPSCYITAMPMRVANRIFKDPDTDPEQDPPGFLSNGIDHAGLLLMMYPRPVLIAAASLDFFPIEGTRKTFNEVQELYQRFGYGSWFRMTESYNDHQYSLTNQLAALRFLAEVWHLPRPAVLPAIEDVEPVKLLCTHTGQVIAEFADAQPLQVLLKKMPVKAVALSSLRMLYEQTGSLGNRVGAGEKEHLSSWELRGTSEFRGIKIDRYSLQYGDGLRMPILHIYRAGTRGAHAVLMPGKTERLSAEMQWQAIDENLRQYDSVLLFDFRAEGENAMPYLVHGDDPEINRGRWDSEYANALSSVLANLTYNSILLGRPYLLDRVQDTEVAARFAQVHLGIKAVSLQAMGDSFFAWAANGILRLNESDLHSPLLWFQSDDEPIEDTVPTVLLQ